MLPDENVLVSVEDTDKYISSHEFTVDGSDFASSGIVSSQIKSTLKNIGYDPQLIRRVAIATYEAEMNVFLHAVRANVTLSAGKGNIIVVIDDEGKGIPNIEEAMQEGFTTATDDQRALGFGAGMGLPNIKKNTDKFDIATRVGEGTMITMKFLVS
ncbi:MAG: ATP-binding protein [Candidatus Marinimicrobia bacterium]|nr:ATP-binding protein [Candidatus Neomarinimicrobiota bacterium]